MNYMISRDGEEFGPYALADLQRYVANGDILLTDMVRSEGMTDFLPVSQVIGTIPVPAQVAPISMAAERPDYPSPPNLPLVACSYLRHRDFWDVRGCLGSCAGHLDEKA